MDGTLCKMDGDSRTVPVCVTDNSPLLIIEIRTFTWKKQTKKKIKKIKKTKNNKISLPNFCFFLFLYGLGLRFLFNLLRIGEYI